MIKRILISLCLLMAMAPVLHASDQDVNKRLDELERKVGDIQNKEDATNDDQQKNIDELKVKLDDFDSYLHRQKGLQSLEIGGFKFGLGGTFILQGAHDANSLANQDGNVLAPSFSMDITVEREIQEIDGDLFMHLEAGQGLGVEDDIDAYSNVNRDVGNDLWLRPTEIWYEQLLFSNIVALKIGRLDPTIYFDTNRAANDETTQFIARTFRNNPAIEFPINNNMLGFKLSIMPVEWFEVSYGLFDANTNWDDFSNHLFQIGELKFKPVIGELVGNYRLIAWYNSLKHTEWLNTNVTHKGTYGFALSFDQDIVENVKLFGRYGWQCPKYYNPNRTDADGTNYSIEQAWSAGLSFSGAFWGRKNDRLAFGVAQVFPSDDYKKVNPGIRGKTEFHGELYYSLRIIRNLALTPDFQVVGYPFGGDAPKNRGVIYLGGLRVQVDF